MNALISVIMPAYNCGSFVGQAITSILDQTYTHFELVICDDASTDNTWNVICSFHDTRIRRFRSEVNRGLLGNFNYLLQQARGEFITCQDADDWSEPTRLEEQARVFDEHPEVSLVGCNGSFYYDDNLLKRCPGFESGPVTVQTVVQPFILPAILYRANVLSSVKGFHPYFDKATSMDQYFVFNILDKFKGYAINKYLYTARFNPGSNTRNLDNFRKATAHEAFLLLRRQRLETGSDWLLEGKEEELLEYERTMFRKRSFRGEKYREYAVYKVDSGQLSAGIGLLMKAFLTFPFNFNLYRTMLYAFRRLLRRDS